MVRSIHLKYLGGMEVSPLLRHLPRVSEVHCFIANEKSTCLECTSSISEEYPNITARRIASSPSWRIREAKLLGFTYHHPLWNVSTLLRESILAILIKCRWRPFRHIEGMAPFENVCGREPSRTSIDHCCVGAMHTPGSFL